MKKIKYFLLRAREVSLNIWRFFTRPSVVMSNSRFSTYDNCPLKYKYSYEDGIKGFPSCYLHFGSVIHTALERFHIKFDLQGVEGNLDDLIKEYEKAWPEIKRDMLDQASANKHRWKNALAQSGVSSREYEKTLNKFDFIYREGEDEKEFYSRGVKMLEDYFKDNQVNPNRIIEIEKPLIMTLRGTDLLAYIDRIEKTPEGELEIVDYKTGQRLMDEEAIKLGSSTQAVIYTMMSERKWKKKLKNFYFYFLSHRKKIPCNPRPEIIEETKDKIIETEHNIHYEQFDPSPGPLCGWCDYEVICPQWKGGMSRYRGIFRKAKNEGRMAFSYSKMSAFKNCPYNYKKLYVDKVAPRPQSFFSIGHSCHETMEEFFTYPYQPSIRDMKKMFENNWHREGYRDEKEEMEYKKKAWDWLLRYYRKYIDGQYIQAYAVEKYFQLPIGDDYVIIGYIDRLQKNPDGSFEILDYKTDPKLRTQEQLDSDLQLTSYYWAMKEVGIEVSRLSLDFLKFTQRISTSRSPSDIPPFIDMVNEVVGNMEKSEKEVKKNPEKADEIFKPKINKYCGGCDFFEECPKKEEIRKRADEIGIMNLSPQPKTEPDIPEKEETEEERYSR